MDWWMAMWEFFFNHPVQFFAILLGSVIGIGAVSWLIGKLIDHIRLLRWANRQVWYVDGGGNIYRKDHDDRQR